jgi:hypothetical protein
MLRPAGRLWLDVGDACVKMASGMARYFPNRSADAFMSRTPYQDYEGSRGEFLKMLMEQGEEPSFLRRAREVQDAWDGLLKRCQSRHDETLRLPRMHLGNLSRQVNGDWSRLAAYLADENQVSLFAKLHEAWKPRLPAVIKSPSPWSSTRSSLLGFADSVDRFNRVWNKFLVNVDLSEVNRLRSNFNQYYPIEKAAAFDSEAIERLGFEPLDLATVEHLHASFPPLEVPTLLPR